MNGFTVVVPKEYGWVRAFSLFLSRSLVCSNVATYYGNQVFVLNLNTKIVGYMV
jgi:hypothetical protein